METNVRTPLEVFSLPQLLVVPLFQRPYVWDESDQWIPLWQDVRRIVEFRLADPANSASHFLGAIVMQSGDAAMGSLQEWSIIDGQQRLTTLQLLIDAAGAVLEEYGFDQLAARLQSLTHNAQSFASEDGALLKLRHLNRDRAAFVEVMTSEPPIAHSELASSGSLITRAHAFFVDEVRDFLREVPEQEVPSRADALANVLTQGLQVVVIGLRSSENSQEIFETLNARGTPLTAADLVKNFVFQRLKLEGADTAHAYQEHWPFERPYWEKEVGVGRYLISRSSLFLNQWLVSRLGEEVGPKSTFTRFKAFVEHETPLSMSELLLILKDQAAMYEAWSHAAEDPDRTLSVVERAVYRMRSTGVELLQPILLWMYEPGLAYPESVRREVIRLMESWLFRRQLLRLTSADQGRVVADVIRLHRNVGPEVLVEQLQNHLTRLSVASTYWPGDDEIRQYLLSENMYRRFPRGRLRMFLEAIEDRLRAPHNAPPIPRRGYHIEHVMPQKWETNWPVDLGEQEGRRLHVHRLGNLTLLTESLNSSVSNSAWGFKREKLKKYDVFLLNRELLAHSEDGWDEAHIDDRTRAMVDALLDTWRVPPGHTGEVKDPRAAADSSIEIRDLLRNGLLEAGSTLHPRGTTWAGVEARVLEDGSLELHGKKHATPSAAGRQVRGRPTNGWTFWRLPDGRSLADLRATVR